MLDFARSNKISTQTSNICLNHLQWYGQFAEVYMLLEVLSLEIYPDSNSFPSVPQCRDWPAAIDQRCIKKRASRPDRRPPDTASLRAPSIPGRWMQNLGQRPMRIIYLSDLIRVTIWVCEILTLFSDFRYQCLKVYRNSINTKSWIKDVIQGFAQKAVKAHRASCT